MLLIKIGGKIFKIVLNFPPYGPHKSASGEIVSFRFLVICFLQKVQYHLKFVPYGETKKL